MLNMNNSNVNFNGNSADEEGKVLATMSANYWGQGVNFTLNLDNIANDCAQINTDFAEFKTKVLATIAELND